MVTFNDVLQKSESLGIKAQVVEFDEKRVLVEVMQTFSMPKLDDAGNVIEKDYMKMHRGMKIEIPLDSLYFFIDDCELPTEQYLRTRSAQ